MKKLDRVFELLKERFPDAISLEIKASPCGMDTEVKFRTGTPNCDYTEKTLNGEPLHNEEGRIEIYTK